jgi:hypothetical protein
MQQARRLPRSEFFRQENGGREIECLDSQQPVDERVPFHHSPESPGRCDGYQSNLVSGENHSLSQEHDKRQAAALALALAVQRVLESNHASSWTLVAPAQWKNEILSFIPSEIRNHLLDSTEGGWTKFPRAKIEFRLPG